MKKNKITLKRANLKTSVPRKKIKKAVDKVFKEMNIFQPDNSLLVATLKTTMKELVIHESIAKEYYAKIKNGRIHIVKKKK